MPALHRALATCCLVCRHVVSVAGVPAAVAPQILPEHLSPKNITTGGHISSSHPAALIPDGGPTNRSVAAPQVGQKDEKEKPPEKAQADNKVEPVKPSEAEGKPAAQAGELAKAEDVKPTESVKATEAAKATEATQAIAAKDEGSGALRPADQVPEPVGSHDAQMKEAASVAEVDKSSNNSTFPKQLPSAEELKASKTSSGVMGHHIEYFEGCTFLGAYALPAIDSPTQRLSTEVFAAVLLALALALALTGKCLFGGWLGTLASFTITLMGVAAGVIFGLFCWYVFYSTEGKPSSELRIGFITGDTWWFWVLYTLLSAIVVGALAFLATKMTALLVGAAIGFPVGAVIVMAYQSAVGALPAFAIPAIIVFSCLTFAIISQCFFGGDEKGERLIAIATALVGGTLTAGLGRMIVCINGISAPPLTDIGVLCVVAGGGMVVQLCLCSGVTFNKKKESKK